MVAQGPENVAFAQITILTLFSVETVSLRLSNRAGPALGTARSCKICPVASQDRHIIRTSPIPPPSGGYHRVTEAAKNAVLNSVENCISCIHPNSHQTLTDLGPKKNLWLKIKKTSKKCCVFRGAPFSQPPDDTPPPPPGPCPLLAIIGKLGLPAIFQSKPLSNTPILKVQIDKKGPMSEKNSGISEPIDPQEALLSHSPAM